MRLLFAAGDVGGARALMPVIELADRRGLDFLLLDHGYLSENSPSEWPRIRPRDLSLDSDDVVCFTSSVADTVPLQLARHAKAAGLRVIHLLDSWTSYRTRMETDGGNTFVPDKHAVMDELGKTGAIEDGIAPQTIEITGQPALSALSRCVSKESTCQHHKARYSVVFVSEPVESDQRPDSQAYRGYTEKQVLRLFCEALAEHADQFEVSVLVHPREDHREVAHTWEQSRGPLTGAVIANRIGRQVVAAADAVAGMASILLYEAWLLGKPVITLQPELRLKPLRMLQHRSGVCFVDSSENVRAAVSDWATTICRRQPEITNNELERHRMAAARVLELAKVTASPIQT